MNVPTMLLNGTALAQRAAECPDCDFASGANNAGSNACGMGIASTAEDPKLQDWTLLSQFGFARTPQVSEHIGSVPLGAGQESPAFAWPIEFWDNENALVVGDAHFIDNAGTIEWVVV